LVGKYKLVRKLVNKMSRYSLSIDGIMV